MPFSYSGHSIQFLIKVYKNLLDLYYIVYIYKAHPYTIHFYFTHPTKQKKIRII